MKTKNILAIIAATVLFMGCKKEIQMDLKEKDVKVVIEGGIASSNTAEITLTKTTDFNNSNQFPLVSGADVTVSDNVGNTEKLIEVSAGKYKGSAVIGQPGRTYFLKVLANDKNYSAISTMPEAVNLDTVVGRQETLMGSVMYNVYPVFKDPAGNKNYYRLVQYQNATRMPGSSTFDDRYIDGNYNIEPLMNGVDKVTDGDKIEVELQCIDKNVFNYFNSMAHTNMGSAAPSNPVSNIEGGALGYFSAYTRQVRGTIVKK